MVWALRIKYEIFDLWPIVHCPLGLPNGDPASFLYGAGGEQVATTSPAANNERTDCHESELLRATAPQAQEEAYQYESEEDSKSTDSVSSYVFLTGDS